VEEYYNIFMDHQFLVQLTTLELNQLKQVRVDPFRGIAPRGS